ncbi:hypothetical protein [Nocardia rhizosphaerihabitans]|uniref:DUF222 domain-containing protein n=1 Tax=Nocardia rhizosphaerihabitans TaxID=1691570 RepID=A0ABQ2K5B3_9NOCA|nr:hypothetical protein [Nocardia rhizosphaerihabitans]GGN66043.1 hypothetical protein GCM10011610_00570 [Nocardia rhizosphaerihabitans]
MTSPVPHPRLVAELPAAQAEVLAQIQDLARQGAAMRREHDHSPELVQIDRDRSLAEATASARGVPAVWINQARELGTRNRAWRRSTVLRDPPKNNVVRRGFGRVVDDTRRLADMAAVTAVREHYLHSRGIDADPEPVVAHQLRRNMEALRTRIIYTADAIKMSPVQRVRSWTVTGAILTERVHSHRHLAVEDMTALWRDHGTPAVAASVRSSLSSLRRTTTASSELDMAPATTQDLLTRARQQLGTGTTPRAASEEGRVIDALVDAATPTAAFEPDALDDQEHRSIDEPPGRHPTPEYGI